jgi:hypothetical protein
MKKQRFTIGAVLFWCVMAISSVAWCGDNGNGTVTVNGLVWLKDAGCLGYMNWDNAMARAKSLAHGQCGLSDNSKIGDWRLPSTEGLKAIYSAKSQFKNVQASYYWSSSTFAGNAPNAWYVSMVNGYVNVDFKGNYGDVWPVRAGQ